MSNKIDGLIACMGSLVTELAQMHLDWRVTTVPFGDLTVPGDRIVGELPFLTSEAGAKQQLRNMPRFHGGANDGESAVEAMIAAVQKPYREQAVKVLVLITDEPALLSQQVTPIAVDNGLAAIDAAAFTVAPNMEYYKRWAISRGGRWHQVAQALDTSAIAALFRSLLAQVVEVTDLVHRLGNGSVQKYLERGSKYPAAIQRSSVLLVLSLPVSFPVFLLLFLIFTTSTVNMIPVPGLCRSGLPSLAS